MERLTCAQWLETHLKISGLKAREVAERLGVSPALITLWRKGKQDISMNKMIELATMFGVDPLYARNIKLEELGWDSWEWDERIRLLSGISRHELRFLEVIRETRRNPRLREEDVEAFRAFLATLPSDGER